MMVSVRRAQRDETLAAIRGPVEARVEDVNRVHVLGVGEDVGEIPGALGEAMVLVDAAPAFAAVVGAVKAAFGRFDQRVDSLRVCTGNGNSDAPPNALG